MVAFTHYMLAVAARDIEAASYRTYMANSIWLYAQSLRMETPWRSIIIGGSEGTMAGDDRTAEEIVDSLIERMNADELA